MQKNRDLAPIQPGKPLFPVKMLPACFLIAAAFIAVCSKSSPLYPINDWGDANAFVTVARMMMKGRVLYTDIFEQKGLYLYLLHIPATLVSYPSFFGVYLLETLTMTFFLFFASRSLALHLPLKLILPALPVLAFSIAAFRSFSHGDSAEELMLPFLAYSLFKLLQWSGGKNGEVPGGTWVLQGVVTAVILWTKYTILGLQLGFLAAILILSIRDKDLKGLLNKAMLWLLGVILGSLPALLYFGLTGSFADMFAVYIRSNIVTYAGDALSAMGNQFIAGRGAGALVHLFRIIKNLAVNPLMTVLALAGLWEMAFTRRNPLERSRIAVRCVYISMLLVLVCLPVFYNYYLLPIGALSILGVLCFLRLIARSPLASLTLKKSLPATLIIMAVLIPGSLASSQNSYLLRYSREDLPQYQFRDLMRQTPGATLLTHVKMDHGFQNVSMIVPEYKYFIGTNTSLPERVKAWREIIMSGGVDYVISNNQELETLYPGLPYELAATATHPFDGRAHIYRLYRLKGLGL